MNTILFIITTTAATYFYDNEATLPHMGMEKPTRLACVGPHVFSPRSWSPNLELELSFLYFLNLLTSTNFGGPPSFGIVNFVAGRRCRVVLR